MLLVSDGNYEVEISPRFLTNDLDMADLARRQDESVQSQIAAYQERETKAYLATRQNDERLQADRINSADSERAKATAVGNWSNGLNASNGGTRRADGTGTSAPIGTVNGHGSPYSYFRQPRVSWLQSIGGG